ncbi:MAG: PKD domain-containing protein, partial [Thermoplasmata archaeon]
DHDIDTSNTMNGEPIHYLKHIDGQVLEGLDYNNLHIFHSNNFMIRDSLFDHGDGLRLYLCDNVLLENLDFRDNIGDIRFWYSKGTVESCSFIDSSDGIYIYNSAFETSLWIKNTTFFNESSAINTNMGMIYLENVAIFNSYHGILNFEAGTLENVTFEDCENGIHKGNPGVVRLYNSTFKNCTTDIYYDAYKASSLHHICLVNSTFNESRFDYDDHVNFTVSWFVELHAYNQLGAPVNDFMVEVYNNTNTQQHSHQLHDTYRALMEVKEKRFNIMGTYPFNPHNISVSSSISRAYVVPEPDITSYRFFNMTLHDRDPPVTSDDYDMAWHNLPFNVSITAHDNVTSVNRTYYRINDGDIRNVETDGMPQITQEGHNKLEYWSGDAAGNEEEHHILESVKLDMTPPETTDDTDPEWHTSDIPVVLFATDGTSGIDDTFYRINNGSVESVKVSGQPIITSEGDNITLEYWSVDNASNEEPHILVTDIKLDKTPPQAQFTPNRTSVVVNGSVSFNASGSSDAPFGIIASYQWDIDGYLVPADGEYIEYVFTSAGSYTVTLNVTDQAGNWDMYNTTIIVQVDSGPDDVIPPDDSGDNGDDSTGPDEDGDQSPTSRLENYVVWMMLPILIVIILIVLIAIMRKRGKIKEETPELDEPVSLPEHPPVQPLHQEKNHTPPPPPQVPLPATHKKLPPPPP